MAKTVGYACSIRLQWLKKAIQLLEENLDEATYKQELNEYLSFEIDSPTRLRKTREILMNIWVYENEVNSKLRDEAISIIQDMPKYALVVHWCMMMASYPVFVDMCKLIGRLSEFQDEISLSQIKQRLYDEWGERTTLYHSIDKLISTLKELNLLSSDRPGKYKIVKHAVRNNRVSVFMIYAMMLIGDSGYYSFAELSNAVFFYPFEYQIEKELILGDSRFSTNNFGGELSVSVNA